MVHCQSPACTYGLLYLCQAQLFRKHPFLLINSCEGWGWPWPAHTRAGKIFSGFSPNPRYAFCYCSLNSSLQVPHKSRERRYCVAHGYNSCLSTSCKQMLDLWPRNIITSGTVWILCLPLWSIQRLKNMSSYRWWCSWMGSSSQRLPNLAAFTLTRCDLAQGSLPHFKAFLSFLHWFEISLWSQGRISYMGSHVCICTLSPVLLDSWSWGAGGDHYEPVGSCPLPPFNHCQTGKQNERDQFFWFSTRSQIFRF